MYLNHIDFLSRGESSSLFPVDLFEVVNVEVDGAVEHSEEVAEAGGVLHPGGPVVQYILKINIPQI